MTPKLTNSDDIIDIWLLFFEALSVSQFNWIIDDLKFPFEVPEDLRSLAQDFVIAYHQYLQKPMLFESSIILYQPNSHPDPLLGIGQNMFSQLQERGYATDILNWINQYHYKLFIGKEIPEPTSHWDSLLEDWAYTSKISDFSPLDLSEKTTSSLQLLILRSIICQYELRFDIDHMKKSDSKNQWEQYMFDTLYIGTWFSLQTRILIHLERWQGIFKLLSDEEIETIEKWGWQQFANIGFDYRESLLEFKSNLNKRKLP